MNDHSRNVKGQYHHRSYATYLDIAKNALKTINAFTMQHENTPEKRNNIECIYFDSTDLNIICYHYLCATWENYLEHLGYILFNDWDSNKKQRHYNDKVKRLQDGLKGCILDPPLARVNINDSWTKVDYTKLENEWSTIMGDYNLKAEVHTKRNAISHVHTERDEIISGSFVRRDDSCSSIFQEMSELQSKTPHGITKEENMELLKHIETFIQGSHAFLRKYSNIFDIYHNHRRYPERFTLWNAFLCNPNCPPMYSSSSGKV